MVPKIYRITQPLGLWLLIEPGIMEDRLVQGKQEEAKQDGGQSIHIVGIRGIDLHVKSDLHIMALSRFPQISIVSVQSPQI